MSESRSRDAAIHPMGRLGARRRYGGSTPDGGFGCGGLIAYLYRESPAFAMARTAAQLASVGEAVPPGELRTAGLVVFGCSRSTHAGDHAGGNRFAHAPSTGGEVRLDRPDGVHGSRRRLDVRRT